MKHGWSSLAALGALALGACAGDPASPVAAGGAPAFSAASASLAVNVLLTGAPTPAMRAELARFGAIRTELPEIGAVSMRIQAAQLRELAALPFVAAAGPDRERSARPTGASEPSSFVGGISSWDQDAINVTDGATGARTVRQDGTGVFVGVLDSGLLNSWRSYFPEARVAAAYARSFTGSDNGTVAEQPNKWEQDQDSHGTHVTSTILGYDLRGTPVNGTAPNATVIPVKVLNQNGSGWSSMVAAGIVYVANLKAGALAKSPVVINMSLGGPSLDAVEQAAIDYAIGKGVIVVAAAGNEGGQGMLYPGAYAPVISVAAVAWRGLTFSPPNWRGDVPERDLSQFAISDFSSRAVGGQELDVAAPGENVVGPYQTNGGPLSYYYLGGTSMASPHVAGVVALMAQKKPSLTPAQAQLILKGSAQAIPGFSASEQGSGLVTADRALAATK